MAETPDGQEKTEQPTGKRRSKARSAGQVARSTEVCLVADLMAALYYLVMNGSSMVKSLKELFERLLNTVGNVSLTQLSVAHIADDVLLDMGAIMLPYMLTILVVGVMSNVLQFGWLFTLQPLHPKFKKLNIISGIKRLFSFSRSIEMIKSIVKLIIIGTVPYLIIKKEIDILPLIMDMDTWQIMSYIGTMLLKILYYVGLVYLLLAGIDLIYQRRKHNKDLMMTKEEVKDEHRQAEGDPLVKAKIRSKQHELLRRIMMQNVPKADVVVTNPVHLAVALKYDRSAMEAPKVVAKGARLIAEKIKKIARENNVPIIENKPLAQSLYKLVEVGESIPETLYKAVAEVLAYVYTQKKKKDAA